MPAGDRAPTTATDFRDELSHLTSIIMSEAQKLHEVLDRCTEAQWERSPAMRGSGDPTGVRAPRGGYEDPTADIATDPSRLYLRLVMQRSVPVLRAAAVSVRGTRRGLELALNRWKGPEGTQEDDAV